MAYRETERVSAQKRRVRACILDAARHLIAEDGYRAAHMASVAGRAGVATGTVYRYFPSKSALLTEVFRAASRHELEALEQAARGPGSAVERLCRAMFTFAERALRGRRLAFALIAEPAMPEVDAERLVLRQAYARLLRGLLEEGVASGELPPQDVHLSAAALVGTLSEALVGPLSPCAEPARDNRDLISSIITFGLRAVSAGEISHESAIYRSAS